MIISQDFEALATGNASLVAAGYTCTDSTHEKVSTTRAYAGTKSLEIYGIGAYSVSIPVTYTGTELCHFSFAVFCPDVSLSYNSSNPFFTINAGPKFYVNSSRLLRANNNGTTQLALSTLTVPMDSAWHIFDITYDIVSRQCIFKIDTVEYLNYTHDSGFTPSSIKYASFRHTDSDATYQNWTYYDNILVEDVINGMVESLSGGFILGGKSWEVQEKTTIVGGAWLNNDSPGWDVSLWYDETGNDRKGSLVHYMETDKEYAKLYVISGWTSLQAVIQIDIPTWTIKKSWNKTSEPVDLPDYLFTQNVQQHTKLYSNNGKYIVVRAAKTGGNENMATIINTYFELGTFTYNFGGLVIFRSIQVIPDSNWHNDADPYLRNIWIDGTTRYCLFTYYDSIQVGILEDVGFNYASLISVLYDNNTGTALEQNEFHFAGDFLMLDGVPVISFAHDAELAQPEFGAVGRLHIGLSHYGHSYGTAENKSPEFPILGMKHIAYLDGYIYGTIEYISGYGQDDYRGMISFNLENGKFKVLTPSWATENDCKLNEIYADETFHQLYIASDFGVTIYTPGVDSWVLYNNENVPGLTISGKDYVKRIRPFVPFNNIDGFYGYSEPPNVLDAPCVFKLSIIKDTPVEHKPCVIKTMNPVWPMNYDINKIS
mgnify:CR=1 FL=1